MVQSRAITEGFDLYPATPAQAGYGVFSTWTPSVTSSFLLEAGRFGGQCLTNTNSSGREITRGVLSTTQIVVGFAYRRSLDLENLVCGLQSSAGNPQFYLSLDSIGRLFVSRTNSAASALAITPERAIHLNTWHYIEWIVELSDTVGSCEVWLDGVEVAVLTLTNIDTKAHADSDIGRVRFGTSAYSVDDMYVEIDGLTRVGEGRITTRAVSADDTVDFVPSTGSSNYATIDEIPPVTTDYNSSTTTGDKDLFAVADLGFVPTVVYGVQVSTLSQKDEAGTRTMQNRIVSGGVEENGQVDALTLNSFTFKRSWHPTDPDGAVAWTGTTVDSVKIGYELVL